MCSSEPGGSLDAENICGHDGQVFGGASDLYVSCLKKEDQMNAMGSDLLIITAKKR